MDSAFKEEDVVAVVVEMEVEVEVEVEDGEGEDDREGEEVKVLGGLKFDDETIEVRRGP
jgi:hypothetical protein